MRELIRLFAVVAATAALGCSAEQPVDDLELSDNQDEALVSVEAALAGSGCSTAVVAGLSERIIAEANCVAPGAFVRLPERSNIALRSAVWPYLEAPARDALIAAADSRPDVTMNVSSMLRTLPQQVLLYGWHQRGACDIPAAAKPGRSNHESGLAIDLGNYGTWRGALEAQGFDWFGNDDAFHFDYRGHGAKDFRGTDVLAFQRLWNRNHPEDVIAEDGDYSSQTASRILRAPADGFAIGSSCGDAGEDLPSPGLDARFFDVGFYADLHADLRDAFGSDAGALENHWIHHGRHEGRMGSPVFSSQDYLQRHPDLVNAFGAQGYEAAMGHWVANGIAEGRQASPVFHAPFYLQQHPDLANAFGSNNDAAVEHWLDHGIGECRRSSPGWDPRYYLQHNPDVASAVGADNCRGALVHYLTYGRAEGRAGS